MSISDILKPSALGLSKLSLFNIAQMSQKINDVLSGATANFSSLGSDFVGLDVQNFYVIKEEIDAFLERCNDIKASFQIGEVEIGALKGATGYSALLYANSVFSLIDSYLSFFKSFSALSEESLEKIEEGEKKNSEVINEEASNINSADIGLSSTIVAGGAAELTGAATGVMGDSETSPEAKIINESEDISKELSDFEKTEETVNIEQVQQTEVNAPANTGQVLGTLSPGTTKETYQAQAYNLDSESYKTLCATVYAEASELPDYIVSDSMGVTSAICNRADAGNWGGSTVIDVVSASGQFSGYGYQNEKFAAAMNDPSVIPAEMRAAIDRVLAGERNTTGVSFSGNGTYNSFR